MVLFDTPGVLLSSGFMALPPPGEEMPFSMSEEPSTASFNEDVVLFGTGQTMTVPSLLADCWMGKRRRRREERGGKEEERRRKGGGKKEEKKDNKISTE
jgi:hypothetical protein